ncbi:MAG: ISNCY family transposase, partial [bacterium]
MAKDIIMATREELNRLYVIKKVLEGGITRGKAAKMLSLSTRQVKRLVKKVKLTGDAAVVHLSRGKSSHRKLSDEVSYKVLNLYKEKYPDFGPTLFTEKLYELHGIYISKETARKWLLEE